MQRTNFGDMACSIARTLDIIGEPWSPLILRDVWVGFSRFEQIQADLGISRKVLECSSAGPTTSDHDTNTC
jgi:DNA-binding HxlR family transcriptional regulator